MNVDQLKANLTQAICEGYGNYIVNFCDQDGDSITIDCVYLALLRSQALFHLLLCQCFVHDDRPLSEFVDGKRFPATHFYQAKHTMRIGCFQSLCGITQVNKG